MFPFDPEFLFTERMKITMDKEAYEGLKNWHDDTVSGMFDQDLDKKCKFCGMDPCFIDTNYTHLFLEVGAELEELGLKNNEIRHGMYREAFRLWKGHVGAGVRYELPHCVTVNIHDAYPASNGKYVGFKKGSKGGDEENIKPPNNESEDSKLVAAIKESQDSNLVIKKRPSEDVKPATKKVCKQAFGMPDAINPYGLDYYADIEAKYVNHHIVGGQSDTTVEFAEEEEHEFDDAPIQLTMLKNDDDTKDNDNKKQPPPFMPLMQEPMRKTMPEPVKKKAMAEPMAN